MREGEGAGGVRVLAGRVTFEAPACVHQPLKALQTLPFWVFMEASLHRHN